MLSGGGGCVVENPNDFSSTVVAEFKKLISTSGYFCRQSSLAKQSFIAAKKNSNISLKSLFADMSFFISGGHS